MIILYQIYIYMYMLFRCELIDIKNITLPRHNMKFVGEWAKRTSHKLHILSSRMIFFSTNHIYIEMTCLSFLNQTKSRIYGTFIVFDICIFAGKITGFKIQFAIPLKHTKGDNICNFHWKWNDTHFPALKRQRRAWRYKRGNQNPYIEEQTTQWET